MECFYISRAMKLLMLSWVGPNHTNCVRFRVSFRISIENYILNNRNKLVKLYVSLHLNTNFRVKSFWIRAWQLFGDCRHMAEVKFHLSFIYNCIDWTANNCRFDISLMVCEIYKNILVIIKLIPIYHFT